MNIICKLIVTAVHSRPAPLPQRVSAAELLVAKLNSKQPSQASIVPPDPPTAAPPSPPKAKALFNLVAKPAPKPAPKPPPSTEQEARPPQWRYLPHAHRQSQMQLEALKAADGKPK